MTKEGDAPNPASSLGENRFAVYLAWNNPLIRDGWMHLTGFSGQKVTALASPKRLLTREEALDWKQAMDTYDQRVAVTICELVPVSNSN